MTWSNTLITGVKVVAGVTVSVPVILVTALWWYQRNLIYPASFPEGSRKNVPLPTQVGLPYEDVTLTTSDGVKLHAYVIPARRQSISLDRLRGMTNEEMVQEGANQQQLWAREISSGDAVEFSNSRPTVLIFHANAGNMGHRIPIARKFVAEMKCNVFMLSYRGYGLSEGHPSEKGIRTDARTAMEYISTHPLLKGTKLILFGQSLGGAVCMYTAANFPSTVSGVILENTFVSILRLIPFIMPYLPVSLLPALLTDHWDARGTLPKIKRTTPILFLSGNKDALVPPSEMKALRDMRKDSGGVFEWKEFPDGTHNDTYLKTGYWETVANWIKQEIEDGRVEEENKVL